MDIGDSYTCIPTKTLYVGAYM